MTKANLTGARAAIAGFEDPRSFAIRQLLNWADELQAAGKPLPQDNPGDRAEGPGATDERPPIERVSEAVRIRLRAAGNNHASMLVAMDIIAKLEADLSALATGGEVKTELAHVVYHRFGEKALHAGKRISELEAQLADREGLQIDRLLEDLTTLNSQYDSLNLELIRCKLERDSLRERLRLWEATREQLMSAARHWVSQADTSQAVSGGRHVLRDCASAVVASLPAPEVAPEPAELPVQPDEPKLQCSMCDGSGTIHPKPCQWCRGRAGGCPEKRSCPECLARDMAAAKEPPAQAQVKPIPPAPSVTLTAEQSEQLLGNAAAKVEHEQPKACDHIFVNSHCVHCGKHSPGPDVERALKLLKRAVLTSGPSIIHLSRSEFDEAIRALEGQP